MSSTIATLQRLTAAYGGLAAAAGWYLTRPPTPIKPMHIFPIYADTKAMTWSDYAVCRP